MLDESKANLAEIAIGISYAAFVEGRNLLDQQELRFTSTESLMLGLQVGYFWSVQALGTTKVANRWQWSGRRKVIVKISRKKTFYEIMNHKYEKNANEP